MNPNAFIRQATFDKYVAALKSELTLETDGLNAIIDADGGTLISATEQGATDPVPFECRPAAGGVNVSPGVVTMQRSHLLGGDLIAPANAFWIAVIVIPMTLNHRSIEYENGTFGWREFIAVSDPYLAIISAGSTNNHWSQQPDFSNPGVVNSFDFYVPIGHGNGTVVLGNSLPARVQHHLSIIATTAGTAGGDALVALIKHD